MSKSKSVPTEPKLRPGDEGYVGPGYPPKHGQIRPGEVKNPYGRRGKPRQDAPLSDFAADMTQLLSRPVRTKDGQTYSHAEVLFNGLIKHVSAGDVKAVKLYLELVEKYGRRPIDISDHDGLDANDEAILQDYEQGILRQTGRTTQSPISNEAEGSGEDDV